MNWFGFAAVLFGFALFFAGARHARRAERKIIPFTILFGGMLLAFPALMGDKFVIADPIGDLSTNTLADFELSYEFTGFFLLVKAQN